MSLPPILVHTFARPLPYRQTWALQERLHQLQLALRRTNEHPDVLLLLEHRPTYTAGRRQTEPSIRDERIRLENLGADFITATRGGQLTYHGPGQIVGYPLIDLSRYTPSMGAKDYVCRIQTLMKLHLRDAHDIASSPSDHTGVFLDPVTKVASIGVQVRHRLTAHGFAMNITNEPLAWFNQIVACGLDDVRAGSIESKLQKPIRLEDEILGLVAQFGKAFEREMVSLDLERTGQIGEAIQKLEEEAEKAGSWLAKPESQA
ncbi:hypothetical protein NLJ89_g6298 [Agrocybe chaxingu]|uniref:Octanoyltransferase n=1 Tax=Agrocybe chaxingu TaxID=84603 RepID=A0A9W8JYJ7_9AGAR|nr:hypothetical protein NLJ89_g6298 [Agrocybe chaxingu]